MRPIALLAPLVLALAACGSLLPAGPDGGIVRGGWRWPTPAPLPAGAIPVPIDVEQVPAVVRPGVEYAACPLALLLPFTIEPVPGDEPGVRYRSVDTGEELHVRWPVGFSARLAPDLEIVAPDGRVVAREGQPVEGLGGGVLGADDTFTVCMGEYVPQRVDGGSPAAAVHVT